MSVTATPIYPQSVVNASLAILNSTGTAVTPLLAAGTNGTKVESLNVSNTDTNAYTLLVYVVISGTNYLIGSVNVPASAGNSTSVPPVAVLTKGNIPSLALDANTNPYLYLANGSTLSLAVSVAVTSGKTVAAFAQGGNY